MTQHSLAGLPFFVAAIRFARWMDSQRGDVFPEHVVARFDVDTTTAHRWLNAYEEATGKERPRRTRAGNVRRPLA